MMSLFGKKTVDLSTLEANRDYLGIAKALRSADQREDARDALIRFDDPAVVEPAARQMSNRGGNDTYAAKEAVCIHYGDRGVEHLRAMLLAKDDPMQAGKMLSAIGTPSAQSALADAMAPGTNEEVARGGIHGAELCAVREPGLVAALGRALGRERAVISPDWAATAIIKGEWDAAYAIGAAEAVERFDRKSSQRTAARRVLKHLMNRDRQRAALGESDPARRIGAVALLQMTGRAPELESIKLVLDDPDSRVRSAAAQALAESNEPSAVPVLVDLLDDSDPAIRADAALTLATQFGDPSGKHAAAELEQDDVPRVADPARKALRKISRLG